MGGFTIVQIALITQLSFAFGQVLQSLPASGQLGARSVYNLRSGVTTSNVQSGSISAATLTRAAGSVGSSASQAGSLRSAVTSGSTQGVAGLLGRSSSSSAYATKMSGRLGQAAVTTAVVEEVPNVPNQAIAGIRVKHAAVKAFLESQSIEVAEAQKNMMQQIGNWIIPSSELQASLEDVMLTVTKLIESSRKYLTGAEKIFATIDQMGPNIDNTWIEQLVKIVNLAEVSLAKSAVSLASIVRFNREIEEDQRVFKEAKAEFKIQTEVAMEEHFKRLLEATNEVGLQASKILTQALKEWSIILTSHCPPAKLSAALDRLNEVTAPTLADMQNLGPEDIDTAMSDAHHCIEDVKSLLYTCNVPSAVVRQSVPPVQLAIFTCTNKAKSIN